MKRGADQTRSAPVLPPPLKNGFPIESPLHAALNKMLQHDHSKATNKQHKPEKATTNFLNESNTTSDNHSSLPENPQLFAYTNALLHRVTGRYLPASVVGDGATQVAEIAHIQTGRELLLAVQSIQELSKQFHQVAQLVLAHRKELGKVLLKLETTYLAVFEKVLEESLRFYYKYRQEHAEERHHQRKTTLALNTKVEELEETIRVLTHHIEAKEILLKSHRVQIHDLEFQNLSLKQDESTWRAMQDEYRELKMDRLDYEKRELHLRKREQDLWKKQVQMDVQNRLLEHHHHAEQARVVEQSRVLKEQLLKQLEEARRENDEAQEDDRLEHLLLSSNAAFGQSSTPSATSVATTQTQVDDDGVWDIQDGVPTCVSKLARVRMAWRRFDAFVQCKLCHGRPKPHSDTDKAYAEVWDVKAMRKRWQAAVASEWQLPLVLQQFLTHLPRTVMAFKYYTLPATMDRVEAIYDAKLLADCHDEGDGVGYEPLHEFVTGHFLRICSGRQKAEVELYRLLISVKALYRGSSMLCMFARFMQFLHPPSTSSESYPTSPSPCKGSKPIDPHDDVKASMSKVEMGQIGLPKRCTLNQNYLRVYLHARHRAFHHPTEGTSHVICVDGIKRWMPLEYAVDVLKWYLGHLPEDKLRMYCRQLEYNSAIYAGRAISDATGQRLTVRASMRQSMLALSADSTASPDKQSSDDGVSRREIPVVVVNVYLVLELIMDVLQLRNKELDDDLTAMFVSGDANHDGVLSFPEFCAILRPRVPPQFSDRRLLRMFREALIDSDHHTTKAFSISIQAFVNVCTHHGLVSLVASDRLQSPFEVGATFEPHKPKHNELIMSSSGTSSSSHSPVKKKKSKASSNKPPPLNVLDSISEDPPSTLEANQPTTTTTTKVRLSKTQATDGQPQPPSPPRTNNDPSCDSTLTRGDRSTDSVDKKPNTTDTSDVIEEHIQEIVSPRSTLLEASYDDDTEEIQEEINLLLDFV
ncbi:hypothetical protein H257_02598 [Aphanomyces astaci]|uniref:EF-hand domain-containing protein n=1 Tax=Aphanomyces astaci TaxID=112090 RepID=W4H2B5_APHAT|nr:hypothetical protein H257_02598 [Aphanomyces astaci]ETV86140.1 hypothetical protein H257_02598 [Aphanomyces astaci]|eukprot:XP_009824612.1 hypothetical protein H257_02598 [Aphanomyces astaci]